MNTAIRTHSELSFRALALLRAVAAGRADLTASREPDLFIDGVSCGDQFTAHSLAHSGLIRASRPAAIGQRVPAVLTPAGRAAIGSPVPAAA